ncbi:MAG: HAD family hydrolase [Candidatus Hodarchaeota archaeon]
MIDFSDITTLLFDIDNTLLLFDDHEFIRIYVTNIHNYFKEEQLNLEKFMNIFLTSTNKMTKKNQSKLDNLSKFAVDFESRINVSHNEIIKRFRDFYRSDFIEVCKIMTLHPIARDLLKLASNHFKLVAATNPLFPTIANETRFSQTGLDRFPWMEITSAENYHFAKPHIEFYEELLDKINKYPSECMIIGDDPINDMVAGKIGIRTFLVESNGRAFSDIIKTDPNYENIDFPVDYTGTLGDLYESMQLGYST